MNLLTKVRNNKHQTDHNLKVNNKVKNNTKKKENKISMFYFI